MADDCTRKGVLEAAQDAYEAQLLAETIGDGVEEHRGEYYMRDAKGGLRPIQTIRPQDLLKDQLVRRLIVKADTVAGQVQAFRAHALKEVDDFLDVLFDQYSTRRGGEKGSVTLMTVDQQYKVERSIGEFFDFGPELEVARALVMECLAEWTEGTRPELRAIVTDAFQTNKGKVRRTALLQLLALDIQDARWQNAMKALRDAMVVVGTKAYPRFYRKDKNGRWQPISIDIAAGAVA